MNRESFEKVMNWAIEGEIEARTFYQEVAEHLDDGPVKDMFLRLADEELGHKEILERVLKDEEKIEVFTKPAVDLKVAETMDAPELDINMKPADAIAIAMKKEQEAADFYTSMASQIVDSELHRVFSQLAAMELDHKHKMENAFVDIGYPEVW